MVSNFQIYNECSIYRYIIGRIYITGVLLIRYGRDDTGRTVTGQAVRTTLIDWYVRTYVRC